MSKYIDNVNKFITERKIKQTYVSMKSGIEIRKLSRILSGVQDVNSTDMEKIAGALGQNAAYFLDEHFEVEKPDDNMYQENAFYIGGPSEEQRTLARNLIELIECADEVLSAQDDVIAAITEW